METIYHKLVLRILLSILYRCVDKEFTEKERSLCREIQSYIDHH